MAFFDNEIFNLFCLAVLFSLILKKKIKIGMGIMICVIVFTDVLPFFIGMKYFKSLKLKAGVAVLVSIGEHVLKAFSFEKLNYVSVLGGFSHCIRQDEKTEKEMNILKYLTSFRPMAKIVNTVFPATVVPCPFHDYKYRLASFSRCPDGHLLGNRPLQLAENGFYYVNDQVLCYGCGHNLTRRYRESHEEHCRLHGQRNIVTGVSSSESPADDISLDLGRSDENDAPENLNVSVTQDASPTPAQPVLLLSDRRLGTDGRTDTLLSCLQIKHKNMNNQNERENTFIGQEWATGPNSAERLAAWGLYYNGTGQIRCYSCRTIFPIPNDQLNLTSQQHSRDCCHS